MLLKSREAEVDSIRAVALKHCWIAASAPTYRSAPGTLVVNKHSPLAVDGELEFGWRPGFGMEIDERKFENGAEKGLMLVALTALALSFAGCSPDPASLLEDGPSTGGGPAVVLTGDFPDPTSSATATPAT